MVLLPAKWLILQAILADLFPKMLHLLRLFPQMPKSQNIDIAVLVFLKDRFLIGLWHKFLIITCIWPVQIASFTQKQPLTYPRIQRNSIHNTILRPDQSRQTFLVMYICLLTLQPLMISVMHILGIDHHLLPVFPILIIRNHFQHMPSILFTHPFAVVTTNHFSTSTKLLFQIHKIRDLFKPFSVFLKDLLTLSKLLKIGR